MGLLVTGVCVEPDQVGELAGLVAIVAGRSRVRPAGTMSEDTPGCRP
jgi:hypothetical protein